jgi:hypothetical protein
MGVFLAKITREFGVLFSAKFGDADVGEVLRFVKERGWGREGERWVVVVERREKKPCSRLQV